MKEEWKTIVVEDKENCWYEISNHGVLKSHLRRGGRKPGGYTASGLYLDYDPTYSRFMKPALTGRKTESSRRLATVINFPLGFLDDDYDYIQSSNKQCFRKMIYIHQMVMWTWRPLDKYPPDRLKNCWSDIPIEAQQWIKDTAVINHIDHNPTNNRLDNLEWVTQRENIRASVKFHGKGKARKAEPKKKMSTLEFLFQ